MKSTHTFNTNIGFPYDFLCGTESLCDDESKFHPLFFLSGETMHRIQAYSIENKKKIRKKKFLFSSTYQYFDTLFNENLFSDIEYLTCNKIFEMSHVHSYRLVSLVY